MKKEIKALLLLAFVFVILAAGYAVHENYMHPIFGLSINSQSSIFYISPDGNDNSLGTISQPWKTIERALDSSQQQYASGGSALYLRNGVYRINFQKFIDVASKNNLSGTAEHNTLISSFPGERARIYLSEQVSNWQKYTGRQNTGIYYFDWRSYLQQNYPFFITNSNSGWLEDSKPQGVFVDGDNPIILQQVSSNKSAISFRSEILNNLPRNLRNSQQDMIPGDFYYEVNASSTNYGKLFVWLPDGSDPNANKLEVSLNPDIGFSLNWAIFSNISIRYGNDLGFGSLVISGYNNVITNVDSSYNSFIGLDGHCYNCTVQNSLFNHNGDMGSALRGENTIYNNNIFDGNNYRYFNSGWQCGGIKLIDGWLHGRYNYNLGIANMTVRGNVFNNTLSCPALWYDWMEDGQIVENNFFINNTYGVYFETSRGTPNNPSIIRNNAFIGKEDLRPNNMSMSFQLAIASSQYVNVYNNLFYNSPGGVGIVALPSGLMKEMIFRLNASHNAIMNNIFLNVTNPLNIPETLAMNVSENWVDGSSPLVVQSLSGTSSFESDTTSNTADNNIFYGISYDYCETFSDNTCTFSSQSKQGIHDNNILFCRWIGKCVNSLSEWHAYGYDFNSNIVNPFLNDVNNQDFSLKNNSPAIDSGFDTLLVKFDIAGNRRPSGKSSDIGPYEFIQPGQIIPKILMHNGELCENNSDCYSSLCDFGLDGTRRCHMTAGSCVFNSLDEVSSQSFICLGNRTKECVDGKWQENAIPCNGLCSDGICINKTSQNNVSIFNDIPPKNNITIKNDKQPNATENISNQSAISQNFSSIMIPISAFLLAGIILIAIIELIYKYTKAPKPGDFTAMMRRSQNI